MAKFIPHEYQQHCIERVINEPELGLLLAMGLGKTVITLTAIYELKYHRGQVVKALVIAPKKVAESTWISEQSKWEHLKNLRVSLVLGTEKQRLAALNATADVYVINRENTQWVVDHYGREWCFDMVVIDESSSFKSNKAKRFKKLCAVRHLIQRLLALTGTPSSHSLLDLWSQMYLIDKGKRLGTRYTGYRERYFLPDQTDGYRVFSWRLKFGSDIAIQEAIKDCCVSMSAEDYLSLPDCTYINVPVILDERSKNAYRSLEDDMFLHVGVDEIDVSTAAVLTNKLLQLCNGAIYDEDRKVVLVHACKLEALSELIEGLNGQPALVFYNYQHDRDRIKVWLKDTGLIVRELKTPDDEKAWNEKRVDVLLAHPASAAYGLNLQDGGNHVIWFGLTFNLEHYLQANARLHRQGQKQKVIIHHLIVKGGLDEDVMGALDGKANVQENLLKSLKVRLKK